MFIGKAPTPQEALDSAMAEAKAKGVDVPKVLVLTDSCVTVPRVTRAESGLHLSKPPIVG
jgi:hypothetical protein